MRVSAPDSFAEAIAMLKAKGLLPTSATAEQLNQLSADIRERAFFSARVQDTEFLSQAHSLVERIVSPEGLAAGQYMDKARFREIMKDYLQSIGYAPAEGTAGGLQDLSSDARLNLIAEMNVQSAQGFGQFIQANDPAVLDAFPAQELYRLEGRKEPRNWPAIWRGRATTASGKIVNGTIWRGRMIALKDDPIWTDISRFGQPYPPFDYRSGMWIRPVSREDAVAAGLIDWDKQVKRQKRSLTDDLQAGARTMPPELRQRLANGYEGRIKIDDGVLHLIPLQKALSDMMSAVRNDNSYRHTVNIGPVSDVLVEKAGQKYEVSRKSVVLEADKILHIDHGHGPRDEELDSGEWRKNQIPVETSDILRINETLLSPRKIIPTRKREHDRFDVYSGQYLVRCEVRGNRIAVISMWKFVSTEVPHAK